MVKVSFQSLKEIVIHEEVEHKLRNLVRLRVLGLRRDSVAQPLIWAEGVVFTRSLTPPTEDIVKQSLEGIIHFSGIDWALMPKYRSALKSGGVTIPVINVSDNPNLAEVGRALRKRSKLI